MFGRNPDDTILWQRVSPKSIIRNRLYHIRAGDGAASVSRYEIYFHPSRSDQLWKKLRYDLIYADFSPLLVSDPTV
jgi:hypothetical protein